MDYEGWGREDLEDGGGEGARERTMMDVREGKEDRKDNKDNAVRGRGQRAFKCWQQKLKRKSNIANTRTEASLHAK